MHSRLRLSAAALLLANLVPLAGVVWLGWSVSSVIILYWFENVVLGVINVARMLALSPDDASGAAAHGIKLFLVPFFILHYFMFCAGHGVFVFSLFPAESGYFAEGSGIELIGTLGRAIEIFQTPLALAATALALSHIISFFVNYLGGGEYRRLNVQKLMTLPYGRIVILHLTIIFGGFATMALGEPIWLLIIFIAIKIGVDLKMHLKEHLRAAQR